MLPVHIPMHLPQPIAAQTLVVTIKPSTSTTSSIAPAIPLASIIKIVPNDKPPAEPAYGELVCTEADKEIVRLIIETMGTNGKLSLLFKRGDLERLGAQINHLHPFKFLSSIFTSPTATYYMNDVFSDYFKRKGFMDGLGPSMTNRAELGKLDVYVNEFSKEVGVSPEAVRGFIKSRDWEGLVQHLMRNSAAASMPMSVQKKPASRWWS